MERKIRTFLTAIFILFALGLFLPNMIRNKQSIKSATNLKKQNKPYKPPIHNKKRYSLFFEGVPIVKDDKLENKGTLLKNGYILANESNHLGHKYNYEYIKNNGNKIKSENTNISPLFFANSKLYLKVSIQNKNIELDENKIIYSRDEYIKINKNETYQIIHSTTKIKAENLNASGIKNQILKHINFNLSDWQIDYKNSSFFNQSSTNRNDNFYQDTDKDFRQSKFFSLKKDNKYLFFFFRLDTKAFESNKLNKISLSEFVFESEENIIKANYQKYIATYSLLAEINDKQINFDKAILKSFKRDDKLFLLVSYRDIFKIVQLEINSLNKNFETFVKLVELNDLQEINLFKKDKIEFTLAEIKKTFEEFNANFQFDESEVLNQLTKLKTHNETMDLNFYAKNNSLKTILKTLKLKFKPVQEIEKMDFTIKTNNNYFIADDKKINSLSSE